MAKTKKKVNGKMFSSTYQPPEKWTEKKALQLGNDLIMWLEENEKEIFFEKFLVFEKKLYPNLIKYLSEKFPSFCELIVFAKKMQEIRLADYGVKDLTNATMTKFVLTNVHGWKERQETDITTKGEPINKIIIEDVTDDKI